MQVHLQVFDLGASVQTAHHKTAVGSRTTYQTYQERNDKLWCAREGSVLNEHVRVPLTDCFVAKLVPFAILTAKRDTPLHLHVQIPRSALVKLSNPQPTTNTGTTTQSEV